MQTIYILKMPAPVDDPVVLKNLDEILDGIDIHHTHRNVFLSQKIIDVGCEFLRSWCRLLRNKSEHAPKVWLFFKIYAWAMADVNLSRENWLAAAKKFRIYGVTKWAVRNPTRHEKLLEVWDVLLTCLPMHRSHQKALHFLLNALPQALDWVLQQDSSLSRRPKVKSMHSIRSSANLVLNLREGFVHPKNAVVDQRAGITTRTRSECVGNEMSVSSRVTQGRSIDSP
jgi:hypothetical protein